MTLSNVAPTSVVASQAQVKSTIAAEVIKQNAASERSVANLVEQSSQNLKNIQSSTAPGVGNNIDRSV